MKIVNDSLSKEKERCKRFAEKYGISEEDIYAKAEEVYPTKLQEECERNFKKLQKDNLDLKYEDCKDELEQNTNIQNIAYKRALKRGRSFYKRQASKNEQIKRDGKSCFILMRFRDNDIDIKNYNKIQEYIDKNGEEAAKEKGYLNDKGNYINMFGNEINKDNYKSSAIGFFEVEQNGETSYEPRFIRMNYGRNMRKIMPVGKPATVSVTEGQREGPLFTDKKVYWYNDGISDVDDDILNMDLIQHINDLYDKFLDSNKFADDYDDLLDIAQQQINDGVKNSYVGVIATCSNIGQRDDPNKDIPCEFEIYDEFGETNTITVWVPVAHFKGMSLIEDQEGILFLTDMYNAKDSSEIRYHLGSFIPYESEEILQ